jgi:hypothetical protein
MGGFLNRDIARAERVDDETQIQDLLIAQLQREKAALRQALYEMALELAEASVAAAMQSLRELDGYGAGASTELSASEKNDGE